jgi:CHAD domain-containing protein
MAGSTAVEAERKFDVDQGGRLPALASLPGVLRVGPPIEHRLEAVYFDTAQLSLAARGATLRCRSGGTDAGWHLKLPLGPGRREEIAEPLDGPEVPVRLQRLTRAHVRAEPLVAVARIATNRTSRSLYGQGDSVLAEFSDDRVQSQSLLPSGTGREWREWELELVDGPPDLLEAAGALLLAHGARASSHPSKLARALGEGYPAPQAPPEKPTRKGPASAVMLAYLRRQAETLKAMDRAVREDEPDAVHRLRVAARRMRSALAAYKKMADRDAVARLRDELKWAATAVGGVRDIEVMRDRLQVLAAAEPPELLMGPVAQRLGEELGARHRSAHDSGLAALDSERYFGLLDALDAFLQDPPLTAAGRRKAGKATARRVAADLDRVRDAARAARKAEGTDGADAALHEVRKCAKRLRYTAESAKPLYGKRAKRTAKEAARIQETLGVVQDSVVTRDLLRELAAAAYLEGANSFSYGRLHAHEQHRADEALARYAHEWPKFKPKPLRRH